MRTNEKGLFAALEVALKTSPDPMDCHALFEIAAVKEHAESANRVSDYLGSLWRKGLVLRMPAPKDGVKKSRYLYEWRGDKGPKIHQHAMEFAPRILADKPSVLISEEGNVITLEFPNLLITVRQKPGK